jgi:integrase
MVFEESLVRRGRAEATCVKYVHVIAVFVRWLGERHPADVSGGQIDLFLAAWEAEFEAERGRSLSRATVRARICALRAFYQHLLRFGLLVDAAGSVVADPMQAIVAPVVQQRPNDWLRHDEDVAVLAAAVKPSERIVIVLLRYSGLRVSEACALRVSDVDLTPGAETITVRRSKTSTGGRTVPIVPELLPEIRAWLGQLERRGLDRGGDPLLSTRSGATMAPQYVSRLVKRVAFRAGVRPVACSCGSPRLTRHARACPRSRNGEHLSTISAHTLRRTFASWLLNLGVRLEVISKLLGHSNTTVTERAYAALLDSTTRAELFNALERAAVISVPADP